MKYKNVKKAEFLDRPNRFIANVKIDGQIETVHVKNTGRCRELLIPGCTVFLEKSDNPARKTGYDLICVQKGDRLINMDSQAPNKVVSEWLQAGGLVPEITLLKPECKHGASRFDFYVETQQQRMFIEVKGVTLEENGVAMFPDATDRARYQAFRRAGAGGAGWLCRHGDFCDPDARCDQFYTKSPHTCAFAEALQRAQQAGVQVLAYDCDVTPDSLCLGKQIPCCI